MEQREKIILTGDRPTGQLHLGHFVGSLQNRVKLQHEGKQYIMLADVQALTDNADNPEKVRDNIFEVMLDYLAVGIDPKLSTIFVQSMIPQIAELAVFYFNLVTVARVQRNPTVKEEIKQRGFEANLPVGFFVYPIHQAADITIVNADLVPVGNDQLPMIEQTAEIVRKFNRLYGEVFSEPQAVVPEIAGRLPGLDGKAKMSKSLGNAIFLADEPDVVTKKVMSMYTDPNHVHVNDPGQVEGNTVFSYLDIFDQRTDEVTELKAHYQRGGLGDVVLKRRLNDVLQAMLEPIRTRRQQFAQDPEQVKALLREGTEQAKAVAQQTMKRVKAAMKIDYFS